MIFLFFGTDKKGNHSNVFMKTIFETMVVLAVFASALARSDAADAALAKRGQYLVDAAGACADCHTARDWKGALDHDHWLQGAKLDFKPARLMPWADYAPGIAGLPKFATDAEAVTFFETGLRNGRKCAPPMPQYRFSHDDAVAIVSYLRSLPSGTANK